MQNDTVLYYKVFKVLDDHLRSPCVHGDHCVDYTAAIGGTLSMGKPCFFFLSLKSAIDWGKELMRYNREHYRRYTPLSVWNAECYTLAASPTFVPQNNTINEYGVFERFWKGWYSDEKMEGINLLPVPPSTVLSFRFNLSTVHSIIEI